MKSSEAHDLCDAMLYQLNYEATQLGASHVLHTSSSWGLSMPFWPGLSYTTLVGLDSADRLAQLVDHRTIVRGVAGSKPRPVYVQKQSGKVPHTVLITDTEKSVGEWSTIYFTTITCNLAI